MKWFIILAAAVLIVQFAEGFGMHRQWQNYNNQGSDNIEEPTDTTDVPNDHVYSDSYASGNNNNDWKSGWETQTKHNYKQKAKTFLKTMWNNFVANNKDTIEETVKNWQDDVNRLKVTAVKKADGVLKSFLKEIHTSLHTVQPEKADHTHEHDHNHAYESYPVDPDFVSRVDPIFNHIQRTTKTREEMQDDAMNAIVTLAEMAGLLCSEDVMENPNRIMLCKDHVKETFDGTDEDFIEPTIYEVGDVIESIGSDMDPLPVEHVEEPIESDMDPLPVEHVEEPIESIMHT